MARRASGPSLILDRIPAGEHRTYYQELDSHLRALIGEGALPPGTRLPSTRTLADELGLSRNTVLAAYDRLIASGLLESRRGSGTYVAREPVPARPPKAPGAKAPRAADEHAGVVRPFQPGVGAISDFPFRAWAGASAAGLRALRGARDGYERKVAADSCRERLCEHLAVARHVRCLPHQIHFTTGFRRSMDLVIRTVVQPGDVVLLEDPGSLGTRLALLERGAHIVPMPVSDDGAALPDPVAAGRARIAFVSPARQFPTGVTMSSERAAALTAWARGGDRWIVEDDHDSEFVTGARPRPSIQAPGEPDRVIHVGGLSRLLDPVARLGFVVVPAALEGAFAEAVARDDERLLYGASPAAHTLASVAAFLAKGHLDLHVRRLRTRYRERSEALRSALARDLGSVFSRCETGSSHHLLGRLPAGTDDVALAARLRRAGVTVVPLSPFYVGQPEPGLILGSAAFTPAALRAAVRTMARSWSRDATSK